MNTKIVRSFVYPLHELLFGRKTFEYLAQLERLQWSPLNELEELRILKLRALLIHARDNIPFYADRFKKAGLVPEKIQALDDIKVLPFLTKAEIKINIDTMVWKGCPGGLHRYNTGGSSGEPLIFYFDKRRQAYDKAARMLAHSWWNVDVGDRELYLWGSPLEATRQDKLKDLRDSFTNEFLISAFEISEAKIPKMVASFRRFKPKCIFGYPSTIDLFAQMATKQNYSLSDLGVKVVFTTAEVLYDHQRKSIGEHFGGVPVADGYGSREGGFVSHQCSGGSYHIMDPNYIVEFIKDELPVAPGESGEVVLTHFDAWGMPLIRYRTADVAMQGQSGCSCGRSFGTMQNISGRTTDFIVTPDGRWQHALSVIYVVRDIEGVDEFKIIQHEVEDVQVLVKVIPSLFPQSGPDRIVKGFRTRMGDSVKVTVDLVDEIPRDASGKHRYVVSHVAKRGL